MVAWSTTDKTANITVSGTGNLTATSTSASQGGVRCDTSFTGKLYWEALLSNTQGSSTFAVGWANATASLSAAPGTTINSVVYIPIFSQLKSNNVTQSVQSGATGQTARIAFDTVNKLIWVAVNEGLWNNSPTADPAAGTGGFSLSGIGAGPYFPYFASAVSGAVVIARFGSADMWFPIPSGYSTLDTNVQAFEASSKFLAFAILSPPLTAVSSSKFLAFAILGPPQTAISVSKFLGYAILSASTRAHKQDYNFPLPRRGKWPPPFLEKNGSLGTNPNLFPPVSTVKPFAYLLFASL